MSAGSLDFKLTPEQEVRRNHYESTWVWGDVLWAEFSSILEQLERYEARVRELTP